MNATLTTEPTRVTEFDRCDACGARAHVAVTLAGGGFLTFCQHHARKHPQALEAASARIVEEEVVDEKQSEGL
jgi:hypothetical protein